jgi:glycosyltransferase involved in cell wall biosynthesis
MMMFSPNMGGAESVVRFLCGELARSRHEITLVTTDELADEYGRIPGLRVISIGRFVGHRKNKPGRWHHLRVVRLLWELRRRRYDVVHVHMLQALGFVRRHRSLVRAPVCFTVHGAMGLDVEGDAIWSRAEVLDYLSCVDSFNSAARFLLNVVAEAGIEKAREGILIPNGVDPRRLEEISPIELAGSFTALYSGGSRFRKGPDLIMRALPEIVSEIPGFRLYVLREIPANHEFRCFVSENGLDDAVEYVGFVDYPRFCTYLKSSDCVILPSRTEGMAASLVEAFALGRPLIATAVGGTPEIVKHERNGILVSLDPHDIARAVIRLYREPELRRVIGEAAQEKVRPLTWEAIAADYANLYASLAGPWQHRPPGDAPR